MVSTYPQTLTSQWQWQGNDKSYLTCSLLQDWQHGFFTRHWGCPPEELVAVLHPEAHAYRVQQVHGKVVLSVTKAQALTQESFPPADGVVTDAEQQAVWVASADCTPVLIGDVKTGQAAAVHAGWRGTAQRIVPEAIAQFLTAGSALENLRIAMGPAIAGEVYQVSESVAAEIGASIFPALEDVLEALWHLPRSPLLRDPQPGKVRIDVRQVNALQLQQMGIRDEQMAIAPYCTYQQPKYFFSYRRSQQKQVQWSGIVSG
ncbi:MAG: peptidoglycan editing factor PgeF [Cyanophyceae cyanobacterium]